MPGSGFKTFNTGDILTAADVNGYLMKQAVMYFATAAARSAALTAPEEGMVTYLADTNSIEYYDGAAWQPLVDQDVIAAKGDLIVGTGDDTVSRLAVGANDTRLVADSSTATGLKYVADTVNTVIDAKGDLLAGTAADTVARLAVGTNGQILVADSTTATGLKWATSSGGKILNVVSTTKTDSFTTSSDTFVDITGLSASITPSAATSTILVIAVVSGMGTVGATNGPLNLVRGSTNIAQGDAAGSRQRATSLIPVGALTGTQFGTPVLFVDSPATTSSTTYKLQTKRSSASNTIYVNRSELDTDSSGLTRTVSTITVIEIGA